MMSSTVQFSFLQIRTMISIETNSFLESFAKVFVLIPTSFANSVLFHALSISSLHPFYFLLLISSAFHQPKISQR